MVFGGINRMGMCQKIKSIYMIHLSSSSENIHQYKVSFESGRTNAHLYTSESGRTNTTIHSTSVVSMPNFEWSNN